jgi:RimJ/RimL family protein N-acetyltransferase
MDRLDDMATSHGAMSEPEDSVPSSQFSCQTGTVVSVLREWQPGDGGWYVAQLSDPEIQAFTTESVDTTAEDFGQALEVSVGATGTFARAIIDPVTGELAGNLAAQRSGDIAEVHYWLAESARGQGLASRALDEAVEWIRSTWHDVAVVCLHIRSANYASVRVADRVGFVRDETRDKVSQVRGEGWLMTGFTLSLQERR